jgi:hypothetical protein
VSSRAAAERPGNAEGMARPVQKHVHGKAGSYRRAKPALRIAAPDGVESPEALGTVRSRWQLRHCRPVRPGLRRKAATWFRAASTRAAPENREIGPD